MSQIEIIEHLLELTAGIGVYLIAFKMISGNLEAVSSDRLKKTFAKISDNKIIGLCIGIVATVLIQSSSAVTVMTIGFVNAGILSLSQAATIVFGGEIGTTVSGQIVALGLFNAKTIDLNVLFSSFAGLGIVLSSIAKKDNLKKIGEIISGFGILFVGLGLMSSSMRSFSQLDSLKLFLSQLNNVVFLMVAGAIITAIIQSSAAMTSIAITMVATGLISLEQGIYITLGANVGTCFTGVMAAMSSSTNSKRTSVIQLIFNIGGAVSVLLLDTLIKALSPSSVGILFERMFPGSPHFQLAMFHTIFNIASVIVVLPMTDLLVSLSKKIIPDSEQDEESERFYFIDENMLKTPAIAVSQVKKEIVNMADIAMVNFNASISSIINMNTDNRKTFVNNEKELNFLNKSLVEFIVKLTGLNNISKKDYLYLSSTYKTIADIERIGDYSENIMEYTDKLIEYDEKLSDDAKAEIRELTDLINQLYDLTMDVYENGNRLSFIKSMKVEDKVDELTKKMAENHISRLSRNQCSAEAGAQFLKLASDVERIGDHLININDKNYEVSH
ncbi:MAG: Na/Pi cotransporter family protein [Erysipelotrichaceae bacterium]|nr:Na/Pi cotransporter family protein [Erysipelotrichaceae bacterium]MBQ6494275.1 Na/Pi cotransporter family protein [Erysipelotrichaceae bacterium]